MSLQTASFDSSATWDSPYGRGTGARTIAVPPIGPDLTTVDYLSTVVEWYAGLDSSWALKAHLPEYSEEHPKPIFLVFTSASAEVNPLRRVEFRSEYDAEVPAQATEDQIALIRSALSLRVTEFADIMNVSRPTIYSWLEGIPSLQLENRARLSSLYNIAKKWRAMNTAALGKLVREPLFEGKSIIDLLKEPKLNERKVHRYFESIDASVKQVPLAQKRKGLVAEAMRRQGMDPEKAPINKAELAAISGKRFEND